jgi:type VI secretion system protein ImpK
MTDNPFAEPDDSDRTVIRPVPGGKRPAAPPPQAPANQGPAYQAPAYQAAPGQASPQYQPAPFAAGPAAVEGPDTIAMGGGKLLGAAGPLLQLLARLRNTLSAPDGGDLRERAVAELRRFENAARDAGQPIELIRPAHYALCASLDDVVLSTPWGSQSAWATRSLVSSFHQEVRSGERFFDVLEQIKKNPGNFLPVLELMYFCLSLGYMGRYRLSPRGPAEIDRIREDAYAIIRQLRAPGDPALSPRWRGLDAAYKPRRFHVPVWVVGIVALGVLALVYGTFRFGLGRATDAAYQLALTAPPQTMPRIVRAAPVVPPAEPAPAQPGVLDRLRGFLAPEIAAGKVSVLGTDNAPIVRINNIGLFASGSAAVEDGALPLLNRIGHALAAETGRVVVTGYTDNQPIHTLQFPSNLALSQARAQAAAAILDRSIGDQSRITAEGAGQADPIADNGTAAGRAQNRRIEVTLIHNGQN